MCSGMAIRDKLNQIEDKNHKSENQRNIFLSWG